MVDIVLILSCSIFNEYDRTRCPLGKDEGKKDPAMPSVAHAGKRPTVTDADQHMALFKLHK